MIITKRRIMSLSSLGFINDNEVIRFGIFDIDRFKARCKSIGFTDSLEVGETILPDKIGPVSFRNSEGQYILQKDKEKEIVYYPRYWTRRQWAGRGQTEEVTDIVYIPVERYPRKFIPPQSTELTISLDKGNNKLVISPEFKFNRANEGIIVHTVNLILEIFGECQVFQKGLNLIKVPEIRRLSWEVLPRGVYPWNKAKKDIEPFIERAKEGNRSLIYDRLEKIHRYNPDFRAYGKAGFSGYIIFGYESKGLYILESVYTNNATYVFTSNWEQFSRLSKAEILNNNYHKERIIHNNAWDKSIDRILS